MLVQITLFTKMASGSGKKLSPADQTAMHETAEAENSAGEQAFKEAAGRPLPRRSLRWTPRRHALEHSWTLWFDNPSAKSKQAAWGSSIRPVYTFSTVEDFWGLYSNIRPPSKMSVGADFHCFKYGIEPKWEDPVCSNGGKWTFSCSRSKVNMWWLYTLLAMLGEQFVHGDEICGAVVNVRAKQERISIWTKSASNEAVQLVETGKHAAYQKIYKLLKCVLIIPETTASVERVFSYMNYVNNKLHNSMSD